MAAPVGVENGALRQIIDNNGAELFGEVVGIPTTNTVLGRLKDIADQLSGAEGVDAQEMRGFTVSTIVIAMPAFAFSAPALAAATQALVTALNGGVMYTLEGTGPTTVVGHYLPAGSTITVTGNADINNLQFLRQGAVDADVTITLFY